MLDTTKKGTTEPTPEQEELTFLTALEDIIQISSLLSPLVGDSVSELVEICKLGVDNDSQRRFLLKMIKMAGGDKKK